MNAELSSLDKLVGSVVKSTSASHWATIDDAAEATPHKAMRMVTIFRVDDSFILVSLLFRGTYRQMENLGKVAIFNWKQGFH